MISDYWVNDLSQYNPINANHCWGDYQAVFGITLQGKIILADNERIISAKDLFKEFIKSKYSHYDIGLYSWKDNNPAIYVFEPLEKLILNESIKNGLKQLIGVHQIKAWTPVISVASENTLFYL